MWGKRRGNKKLYYLSSCILSVILLATLCTGCLGQKQEQNTQKVDSAVDEIIEDETFRRLDGEQKYQKLQEVLDELSEDGLVKEDTIIYDQQMEFVSFQYADGSLGGVWLGEFNEEYNQGMQGAEENVAKDIPLTPDGLSALILNGFENSSFRRDYYVDMEKEWDAKGLETTVDVDVTVADLKSLNGFDVVVFAMHGSMYNDIPVLCLNEKVTNATDAVYAEELRSGQIAKVKYKDGTRAYWVFSTLFEENYDAMDCELFYSETCMFYGCDCTSSMDSSFAQSLVQLSDGTVIGYHNSVGARYSRNVMKTTIDSLLVGDTYAAGLQKAIDVHGEDDNMVDKSEDKYAAYPVLTGNSTGTLVKIGVNDFTIPDELILTLGEMSVIEPELKPENASDYTIKWSSSDETVATVVPTGEAGIITSRAKGMAVITAELTSGGKTITKSTQVRVASKARDTVLVLDISGSMYGTPMQEMKESAIQFCNDLLKDKYNNRVGLVFYDDDIITVDLTDDLNTLISRIEAVADGGRTNMEAGLATASEMLANFGRDGAIKNVVVMADGLPNEGRTSTSGAMPDGSYSRYYTSVLYANAVLDTAESMKDSCNIYSLGFFHDLSGESKDFAVQLMQKLTNETDGYHQVDRAEDLQFAFGDISEEISIGSKIVINIACPVDVRVTYNGEMLSSAESTYCDMTSFGTLQLLGKDRDIKVLSLDSDKDYGIKLTGTGIGKMDYSVNYFDENEQMSDYRSFEAVPITMTTVITSDTNNTEENVSLNIDNDGDGEVDTVWTAGEKSTGKIAYEKKPLETEPTTEPTIQPEPAPEPEQTNTIDSIVLVSVLAVVAVVFLGGVTAIMVVVAVSRKSENPKEKDCASDDVVVLWYECPKCGALVENPHRFTGGNGEWSCWRCDYRSSDDFKHEDQITEETEQRTGSIQIISGSMNGFAAPIRDGETLCLGKDPKFANIVFTGNYEKVSRMHCTITYDATKKHYYVVDCSSNGTFLAGKVRMEKGKRTLVTPKTVLTLADNSCAILLG